MKKLASLMTAAMVMTVGGVYATWSYAQGNATQTEKTIYTSLTDVASTTSKGTIHIDATGVTVAIDQLQSDQVQDQIQLIFMQLHFYLL